MKLFSSLRLPAFPILMFALLVLFGGMLFKPLYAGVLADQEKLDAVTGTWNFSNGYSLVINDPVIDWQKLTIFSPGLLINQNASDMAAIECRYQDPRIAQYGKDTNDIGKNYSCYTDDFVVFDFKLSRAGMVSGIFADHTRIEDPNNLKVHGYVQLGQTVTNTDYMDPSGIVYLQSVLYGTDRYSATLQLVGENTFKLLTVEKQ